MPDNWRETLFVWDGILTADESDEATLKWSGTWTGVDNADATKIEAPARGAFEKDVKSDMTFEVEGKASPANGGENSACGFTATLAGGPGWDLMDDGADTKSKHSDMVHEVYLKQLRWLGSPDKTTNLVFARGENNFGPFISAGWMRPGNRITLGRRYLGESDGRAKWNLDDLRKAILKVICTDDNVRTPPWQCSVLHVDQQDCE